jgi:hypothetical protein
MMLGSRSHGIKASACPPPQRVTWHSQIRAAPQPWRGSIVPHATTYSFRRGAWDAAIYSAYPVIAEKNPANFVYDRK